ncbi:hypothetical protein ACFL2E_10605 [Thermodesulfobacteriota bacterium]
MKRTMAEIKRAILERRNAPGPNQAEYNFSKPYKTRTGVLNANYKAKGIIFNSNGEWFIATKKGA